jgi:hypothetical protein
MLQHVAADESACNIGRNCIFPGGVRFIDAKRKPPPSSSHVFRRRTGSAIVVEKTLGRSIIVRLWTFFIYWVLEGMTCHSIFSKIGRYSGLGEFREDEKIVERQNMNLEIVNEETRANAIYYIGRRPNPYSKPT